MIDSPHGTRPPSMRHMSQTLPLSAVNHHYHRHASAKWLLLVNLELIFAGSEEA